MFIFSDFTLVRPIGLRKRQMIVLRIEYENKCEWECVCVPNDWSTLLASMCVCVSLSACVCAREAHKTISTHHSVSCLTTHVFSHTIESDSTCMPSVHCDWLWSTTTSKCFEIVRIRCRSMEYHGAIFIYVYSTSLSLSLSRFRREFDVYLSLNMLFNMPMRLSVVLLTQRCLYTDAKSKIFFYDFLPVEILLIFSFRFHFVFNSPFSSTSFESS